MGKKRRETLNLQRSERPIYYGKGNKTIWNERQMSDFKPVCLEDYLIRRNHGNGNIDRRKEYYEILLSSRNDDCIFDTNFKFRTLEESIECAETVSKDESTVDISMNHYFDESEEKGFMTFKWKDGKFEEF